MSPSAGRGQSRSPNWSDRCGADKWIQYDTVHLCQSRQTRGADSSADTSMKRTWELWSGPARTPPALTAVGWFYRQAIISTALLITLVHANEFIWKTGEYCLFIHTYSTKGVRNVKQSHVDYLENGNIGPHEYDGEGGRGQS